ncbi:S-adenosyl-L-methionine-dependent methyltransferase [Dendrothele bispora CBS 962.96]|uniref:S-adenosyl-L-methionine-dependent methyltransferase n=1 Tax=Dendrothele bispora (strain CBS 962.96) TaxID=1314807 RepID=A0A4S8MW37_DENBC|nr:S-adenosyl-L-methionine-dependent methyltransferase [Dendrothele bispora CBS 962.96]
MNLVTSAGSNSTTSGSPPRPSRRPKENQFVQKNGQLLHSYHAEKAPYPLSYNKHILELESLDNRLTKFLRSGSQSFINFSEDQYPCRCLDLGCGTGSWIIETAKEWPKCEFVGFDLVNVQLPLKIIEPSIADRIQFVHGNFLTTKLPFEDDEFDHVHIQHIARGVPENKWDILFEEINRILRPGGSIEMIEDDIVFPTLPRWFTAPLRKRPRRATSVHLPDGTQRGYPDLPDSPTSNMGHDHALLESLHTSVYGHRFINMKPSALLPSYFTQYFRQVTIGPVLSFPMPSIPPLQPLPPQMATAYALPLGLDTDPRTSMMTASSVNGASSFSSIASEPTRSSEAPRKQSISVSFVEEVVKALPPGHLIQKTELDLTPEQDSSESPRLYALDTALSSDDRGNVPSSLVDVDKLRSLNQRSLAMHLYRSFQAVLACQEALWEELKDRLRNRREELEPYGWEDDEEFEEPQNRNKFEQILERYRTDMFQRVALWNSLHDIGWMLPSREPLSRAELIEEERMREAMLEARQNAPQEDLQTPCRSVRVLIGFKP